MIRVNVEVLLHDQISIPAGATCTVEIRDVSLMDVPSKTISRLQKKVTNIAGAAILKETLEFPDPGIPFHSLNVWAHLSLSNTNQIQRGDFITMQAYPISVIDSMGNTTGVSVELKPVT